jgi:hypothetical protein
MSGLRLGMVRERDKSQHIEKEIQLDEHFRIYAISNMALGRDEKVFMSRSTINDFNPLDPFFTRTRDPNAIDLLIDVPPEAASKATPSAVPDLDDALAGLGNASDMINGNAIDLEVDPELLANEPSYLSNLLASLQSLLSSAAPTTATSTSQAPKHTTTQRYALEAALPLGPGAAPLPDTSDPDLIYSAINPLVWSSIYIHPDPLCDTKLPLDIPKKHQIIAIPRGGCSFSSKLHNIPAYPPDPHSLQLVIIISYPEHEDRFQADDADEVQPGAPRAKKWARHPPRQGEAQLVQPLLDELQYSPSGLVRPNPIPLVMIAGGDEAVDMLRRATGVGVRRRYYFLSQGVRIRNLIVL